MIMMEQEVTLIRARLKAPRAGAVAGIVFSTLFIISLVLIRISVPADPQEAGTWLSGGGKTVSLALNLLPFAGIAFLWFVGVVRDRIGAYEDRFFATVFLGSGLLFLAMLFASSAVASGIMMIYGETPGKLMESGTYTFGRIVAYQIMNVYAVKMAGGVYDHNLHARDPHRDLSALDGVHRLRAGAVAPPEQRVSLLGASGLSAVGAPDQRAYTLGES